MSVYFFSKYCFNFQKNNFLTNFFKNNLKKFEICLDLFKRDIFDSLVRTLQNRTNQMHYNKKNQLSQLNTVLNVGSKQLIVYTKISQIFINVEVMPLKITKYLKQN